MSIGQKILLGLAVCAIASVMIGLLVGAVIHQGHGHE